MEEVEAGPSGSKMTVTEEDRRWGELMEVIRVELASIKGAMEYQGQQLLRQNKLLLELMSDIVEDGYEEEAREELLELAVEIKTTPPLRLAEVLEELEEGEEQEEEQELSELAKEREEHGDGVE